jgi:predicted TIM-barrel fold metal-dependent hydrolase
MTARYNGPIIDTDVHHQFRRDDVIPYLPKRWRDYLANYDTRRFGGSVGGSTSMLLPMGEFMNDSYPKAGGPAGSDYVTMKEQVLDRYPIYRVLLTHNVGDFNTHHNPEYVAALCSAINDWNVDHWLSLDDDRLYSVIVAPWATPDAAVAEIKRMADHPRMAGVLFAGNPLGRPLGDPIFHPILEVISECGLALVMHVAVSDRPSHQLRSIGEKMGASDLWPHASQAAMHYISSLIVNGAFEKYPKLRVLFNEYGCGQIPTFVWRLDAMYEVLKIESSWVRRWPSEYVHDHILFSSQPLEESRDDKAAIGDLLMCLDWADDIICFSSDYPHISYDEPMSIQRLVPKLSYRKLFCDNAADLFGWPRPDAMAAYLPPLVAS